MDLGHVQIVFWEPIKGFYDILVTLKIEAIRSSENSHTA
jgi:hypothetical protein